MGEPNVIITTVNADRRIRKSKDEYKPKKWNTHCTDVGDTKSSDDKQEKVLRAAAYCRVSTLEEDQEGSYETQKRAFEEKIAEAPNLTLAGIYGDHGISGGDTKKRKQFQEMIKDCRAGKIDVVLTKSISRFARNLSDTLKYVRELKNLGIPIWFEKENINSMDPSMDILLEVLAAVAQEEINDLSRSVKWSLGKCSSCGNPKTNTCYGYRKCIEGDECKWKICEPEARRVQYAFQMAADGKKYWEILDGLQRMENGEGTGVEWNQQRLRNLLRHEAYIGDLIAGKYVTVDCLTKKSIRNRGGYEKYYIEGHHEPLVTREQFEKVQENIESGVLHCLSFDEIPIRWRSDLWKKNHGIELKQGRTIGLRERGCYAKSRGGAEDVRCIYGKTDCPGW